jgi:hypothetical protein
MTRGGSSEPACIMTYPFVHDSALDRYRGDGTATSVVDTIPGVNYFNITDGWTCAHASDAASCTGDMSNQTLPALNRATILTIEAYGLRVTDSFTCKLSWPAGDNSAALAERSLSASNVSVTRLRCVIPAFAFSSVSCLSAAFAGDAQPV